MIDCCDPNVVCEPALLTFCDGSTAEIKALPPMFDSRFKKRSLDHPYTVRTGFVTLLSIGDGEIKTITMNGITYCVNGQVKYANICRTVLDVVGVELDNCPFTFDWYGLPPSTCEYDEPLGDPVYADEPGYYFPEERTSPNDGDITLSTVYRVYVPNPVVANWLSTLSLVVIDGNKYIVKQVNHLLRCDRVPYALCSLLRC